MRFLCFVLCIQETKMGLPKRGLMLLLSHLEMVHFPKNFTIWVLHYDGFCTTAHFNPALYLRAYCNYHYSLYIYKHINIIYIWTQTHAHTCMYIFLLQCCADPGNLAWALYEPMDTVIWLLIFMQMLAWSQAVQRGAYHLLSGMMFAYGCWLLSGRLSCFLVPDIKLILTPFFSLKNLSLTILKIHSALLYMLVGLEAIFTSY